MATDLKPLIVWRYYDGALSPNPWKVTIFFYELGLPFEMKTFDRADPDVRDKEPMVSLSPNGRMPIVQDPNTGINIWESGAIIEYFLDYYDKDNRLSYTTVPEKYQLKSWLHFQMSGQGPYFGQRAWFLHLHEEKIPSALDRYANEIRRVLGVIDKHLARKPDQNYLVGSKLTFVDLMFVPWNTLLLMVMMTPEFEAEWKEQYPYCWAWHQKLLERESVKKAFALTQDTISADPKTLIDIQTVNEIEGGK